MEKELILDGWNKLYKNGRRGKYPNEMLIRFINSKFEIKAQKKILDIGFGTGRHLVYLAQEGFEVYGVEFSKFGYEIAGEWLKDTHLEANIYNTTIQNFLFPEIKFDAIIDTASLECNTYNSMINIVDKCYDHIVDGGYFFSYQKTKDDSAFFEGTIIDDRTREFNSAINKVDTNTIITFTDFDECKNIFKKFKKVNIEKEEWTFNGLEKKVSRWAVIAQK